MINRPPARDRACRQRGHAHRDELPFGRREGAHRRQELIRPTAVDEAQQGVTALGQPERALAPILLLLAALDEPAPDEPVDEP